MIHEPDRAGRSHWQQQPSRFLTSASGHAALGLAFLIHKPAPASAAAGSSAKPTARRRATAVDAQQATSQVDKKRCLVAVSPQTATAVVVSVHCCPATHACDSPCGSSVGPPAVPGRVSVVSWLGPLRTVSASPARCPALPLPVPSPSCPSLRRRRRQPSFPISLLALLYRRHCVLPSSNHPPSLSPLPPLFIHSSSFLPSTSHRCRAPYRSLCIHLLFPFPP